MRSDALTANPAGAGAGRAALDALYRDHAAAIADAIWRRTRDAAAAEDLASQVFLAAARALPRFEERGIPIRHWLLRIATHEVCRWARARRRAESSLPDGHDVVDPATAPSNDARDAELVRRALLTLPPRHQEVVALHHLEGMEVEAVARVLGCAVGTVKSRLARARALLKERLDDAARREVDR